jgi:hypothetical protein
MALAGSAPESTSTIWSDTEEKYESAQVPSETITLDPTRVREIQQYAFFAEEFTIEEYDNLLSSVPSGLSDSQIQTTLSEFIENMNDYAAEVYIEETFDVTVPTSVSFPTPTTSTTTSTSTTTTAVPTTSTTDSSTSTTSTSTTNQTTSSQENVLSPSLFVGLGIGGALCVLIILVFLKRYQQ